MENKINQGDRKRKSDDSLDLDATSKISRIDGSEELTKLLQEEVREKDELLQTYKRRLQRVREAEMDMITKEDALQMYDKVKKELKEKEAELVELEEIREKFDVLKETLEAKEEVLGDLQEAMEASNDVDKYQHLMNVVGSLTKENEELKAKLVGYENAQEVQRKLSEVMKELEWQKQYRVIQERKIQELEQLLKTEKVGLGDKAIQKLGKKDLIIKEMFQVEKALREEIQELKEINEDQHESLLRVNELRVAERKKLERIRLENTGFHSSVKMLEERCATFQRQYAGYCRDIKVQIDEAVEERDSEKNEKLKKRNIYLREKLSGVIDEKMAMECQLQEADEELGRAQRTVINLRKRLEEFKERVISAEEESEFYRRLYNQIGGEDEEEEEENMEPVEQDEQVEEED